MNYGYFDDEHKEYVITDPKTPVKWINYIGTLAFGGFVDQTGGALLCKGDPALNRMTKYFPQLPAYEFKGETLYVRSRVISSGGVPARYRVHSAFYTPCCVPTQVYECRVGLGYSTIRAVTEGIETEVTIFIPPGASCELRLVQIANRNPVPVDLDLVPLVEYTHFDALKQLTNADWVPQTMQSRAFQLAGGRLALLQYAFMKRESALNYLTASLPARSFESDRRRFLGDNEYGTWAEPLSLLEPDLPGTEAQRGDNIGALLIPLGEMGPGESRRLVVQLGQEPDEAAIWQAVEQWGSPESAERALAGLGLFWGGYLAGQQVVTPDPAANSMLNIHNPRQCLITKNWSRYLSLYQLGFGARGIGFRDSAQDVLGVLPNAPQEAKSLIRLLLQVQKGDGSAMHQFNPLSMVASEGDSLERDDRPHYYSDDHLWIVLAVCAYLKETGDFAFLQETLPFYEKDRQERPLEAGPVWEHLLRAVAFTRGDLGAHGFPRLGFADWNDTLNLAAGAESVLAACLYGKALLELAGLAALRGEQDLAARLESDWEVMRQRVSTAAWDGEWFVSYFDADGTPLGSKANEAGQLYAYGQAWPVIAGFATSEQARKALDSVYHRLNTSYGIKLSTPGFTGYDRRKGGITSYPPGAKENGGIFLHVNPWVMIAETVVGNGPRAYQYYRQTNPAGKNDAIQIYECEPYVYPQNVLSDEHPQFGLARNSWLSGTAAWMYVAASQHILGVRPDWDGLRVTPCIPPEWDGFHVRRRFRGATYEIEVRNPGRVSSGVSDLQVDGQAVEGNLLPVFEDQGIHSVQVVLGERAG
jgi:cellobiose phosphorylase